MTEPTPIVRTTLGVISFTLVLIAGMAAIFFLGDTLVAVINQTV